MDGEHATIVVPPSTFAADLGDRVGSATDADVVFGIPEPALEGHDEPPGTYAYIPAHKVRRRARKERGRNFRRVAVSAKQIPLGRPRAALR